MSQELGTASTEMASSQPAADRKQSRRALFAGTVGAGVGAVAATVLGSAQSASADTGGNCVLGESNTASSTTSITTSSGTGLAGTTSDISGVGVFGTDTSSTGSSGVFGQSTNGTGVQGVTSGNNQAAMLATDNSSGGGIGVSANSTNGTGVFGTSANGAGVQGQTSGTGQSGVVGMDTSAVLGGSGVFGSSANGTGVQGTTGGNGQAGVIGTDNSPGGGTGVNGTSINGTGVQAASGGIALLVTGKVAFSTSGTATVAAGHKSVTVSQDGVTPSSLVLATLQKVQTSAAVAAAVPGTGAFTITMTSPAKTPLPVAWFVIG